jgi:hypothetical protein
VRDGVVGARVGHHAGQQRRLLHLELGGARAPAGAAAVVVGLVAEVRARGGLDPVGPVAEVDGVEVLGEDLLLAPLAREVVGHRGLAELLEERAPVLGLERVLDELLGDRRATLPARRSMTSLTKARPIARRSTPLWRQKRRSSTATTPAAR